MRTEYPSGDRGGNTVTPGGLSVRRSHLHRALVAVTMVALLVPLFALTAHAAVETVTGTVILKAKVALTPNAVAVVTIADRSKNGSGTIIGQQRINGATANQAFSVPYDASAVNPSNAYAVVASIIDAGKEYQNPVAVPTITGGPTEGLVVEVNAPTATTPAQVTGAIALPAGTTLTDQAVAYAIVINGDTGRVIGRQVIVSPSATAAAPTAAGATPAAASGDIPFTVSYDSDLVDPAAPILAVGAVADAGTLWQTDSPTTVTAGTPVALTVAEKGTLPGEATPPPPTASPTEAATPTVKPTEKPSATPKPSGNPTAEPSATPTEAPTTPPTATPTQAPTATPTTAPTATPTATPSPSPTPTVTPSASPSPTPSPGAIVVSGTLVYREPHRLDITSVARVVVAQLNDDGTMTVVGQVNIYNPGAVPIAFSIVLNSDLNPDLETRLWAVIKDGTEAWTSAGAGIAVATQGAPTDNVLVGMFYRPDLIQAELTGTISGTTGLTGGAWTMTWIVDTTSHKVIALDSDLVNGASPPTFLVPFATTDVTAGASYVAMAAVFDGANEWRSSTGTPVITGGNPLSNVVITVAQTSPSATPTPAATATAAPTTGPTAGATPTPSGSGSSGSGGGIDPLVLGVLALIVIGGAVVIYVMRR
jgi:uncharacterized lipoprotein YbaY